MYVYVIVAIMYMFKSLIHFRRLFMLYGGSLNITLKIYMYENMSYRIFFRYINSYMCIMYTFTQEKNLP